MEKLEPRKLDEESSIERTRSLTLKELSTVGQFLTIVEDGEIERIKTFLDDYNDLDVNRYDHRGQTALHVASSTGRGDVIEFLISLGADISNLNKKGDHVLHPAARNGHVNPLRLFKELGVDLDLKNKDGETALHLATRSNHLQVVEYLCSAGADVNLQDKNGETALHISCWYGQQPLICRKLCTNECNLNLKNKEGEAPIHFAAGRGNLDCVKILIEHGADINIIDRKGSTSLHLACKRNHSSVALTLLRAGCKIDVVDQLGETPLHPACHNNLVSVVQTMCAFGCKVDVVNKSGACPLHISTRTGHIEDVRCLLLSGVPAHLPNQQGLTAEVVAISQGHKEIAELIGGLRDKQAEFIRQLLPNATRLERIKVKLFGNSGVGKTALVESLKCGFIGGLLRKARLSSSPTESPNVYCLSSGHISQQKETEIQTKRQEDVVAPENDGRMNDRKKKKKKISMALARKMSNAMKVEDVTEPINKQYTKGIAVQQTNIPGVGEVSVWEFSGYEQFHVCYDHFIGDPNCLHLVLFRATDGYEEQLRQIRFWLEFIRIRLPSNESIGKMGRSVNPSHIILVATFSNEVKDDPNKFRSMMNALHFDAVTLFSRDFSIHPRIVSVDSDQPMSHDMRALKAILHEMKNSVLQHLPSTTQFLNASVAALPAWQKMLNRFPVVTWSNFKEYIRLNVNLLACEEHLKSLVYFLQLAGEIVFLEVSRRDDSLVVISPKWLGQYLLPTLLDRNPQQGRLHPDGIFTRRDLFHDIFRNACDDIDDHVEVLEALELLTQMEEEHDDVVYELATLVRLVRPAEWEIWNPEDIRFLTGPEGGEGVFGGVRLVPLICASRSQLKSIFPRIQTAARRHYDFYKTVEASDDTDNSEDERPSTSRLENDLLQWQGGFKCTRGNLELIVAEAGDAESEWIEIKARGQKETNVELFHFFHENLAIVLSACNECAPSLEFQHHYLSPGQLSEYRQQLDVYLPKDIVLAQKCGKDRVTRTEAVTDLNEKQTGQSLEDCSESTEESAAVDGEVSIDSPEGERLVDVLAFGSTHVYESLVVGLDLPLSSLPVELRRRLCSVLDPPNPTGQDWCLLSVILGQSGELALMEATLKEAFSKTDQVLKRWSQSDEKPTVGMLLEKLEKIGRLDAVEMLINVVPVSNRLCRASRESPTSEKSSVDDRASETKASA